jgi:hypothetical protein
VVVQGEDQSSADMLGNRDDGGVHEAEVGVGVAEVDGTRAADDLRPHRFRQVAPGIEVVKEGTASSGSKPRPQEVVHLDGDGNRDDEGRLSVPLQEPTAERVMIVTTRCRGHEGAGVTNDNQRKPSARYFSALRPRSVTSASPAPCEANG